MAPGEPKAHTAASCNAWQTEPQGRRLSAQTKQGGQRRENDGTQRKKVLVRCPIAGQVEKKLMPLLKI